MSSAIIKMKRGSETDLAEVSKSILGDFKGDVAELSLEQMSEVNGIKVLLLILERYYMRNGSMAVSTVQIIDSGEVQQDDHRHRRRRGPYEHQSGRQSGFCAQGRQGFGEARL